MTRLLLMPTRSPLSPLPIHLLLPLRIPLSLPISIPGLTFGLFRPPLFSLALLSLLFPFPLSVPLPLPFALSIPLSFPLPFGLVLWLPGQSDAFESHGGTACCSSLSRKSGDRLGLIVACLAIVGHLVRVELEHVDDCFRVTSCFFFGDGRGSKEFGPLWWQTLLISCQSPITQRPHL